MAIIRNPTELNNSVNYVASIAFFCCISCIVLMLKFIGFRARINISTNNKKDEEVPAVSLNGAYRAQREEFFGVNSNCEDPRKKITPSMVKLPNSTEPLRPAKSTGNLQQPVLVPIAASKSTSDISHDPRGVDNVQLRNQEKNNNKNAKKEELARKKNEKKRLAAEQKARQKAAQDQAKIQAKRAKEQKAKDKKNKTIKPPPAPPQQQEAQRTQQHEQQRQHQEVQRRQQQEPQRRQQPPEAVPTASTRKQAVSTISLSSGPPPYSELPEVVKNEKDNTGNTSFGKPVDTSSSWDMISQHRQQMSRPTAKIGSNNRKQMVMDLQYKHADNGNDENNSEV